jgi:hypothetical protein
MRKCQYVFELGLWRYPQSQKAGRIAGFGRKSIRSRAGRKRWNTHDYLDHSRFLWKVSRGISSTNTVHPSPSLRWQRLVKRTKWHRHWAGRLKDTIGVWMHSSEEYNKAIIEGLGPLIPQGINNGWDVRWRNQHFLVAFTVARLDCTGNDSPIARCVVRSKNRISSGAFRAEKIRWGAQTRPSQIKG